MRKTINRLTGHKLTTEWNGEYGRESCNTGTCVCGWSETCNSATAVRDEYAWHIKTEKEALAKAEGK